MIRNQRIWLKRPILGLTALFFGFIVLLGACLGSARFYEPGIYEGQGRGYNGIIRVRVTLSGAGMEDIEILENDEYDFAVSVMEELLELALEHNTSNLDAISGATISSDGFLSALDDALRRGVK